MAHGLNTVLKRSPATVTCKTETKNGAGSRRIFAPHFKLQVLDSYRQDADCKGNQRATARKYGIHRRQIQKWLQVENNLRNTVCKVKSDCLNSRTNIDNQNNNNNNYESMNNECNDTKTHISKMAAENCNNTGEVVRRYGIEMALRIGRLQDASPPSQDGVRRQRVPAPISRVEVNAAPLDFTQQLLSPDVPIDLSLKRRIAPGAPSPTLTVPYSPPSPSISPASPPSLRSQPHPDVWDLSTKRKSDVTFITYEDAPKAVKLFKPYLDDVKDTSNLSPPPPPPPPPTCCAAPLTPPTLNSDYYYYNHNNNVCEIKAECTYTIHELQPKTNLNLCCYPSYPPTTQYLSEYEHQNAYYCQNYDDGYVAQLKQRQSYSLDFKLSAIDCYYEDSICKGNQRAVANKYNIHRRQVQKWLKQEDELRQRNDVMKTQLVR